MAVTRNLANEPVIVTERLELWRPSRGDMLELDRIIANPATHRFLGPQTGMPDHFARFLRNAGSWALYGYGGFMVRLRGAPAIIGNCGIFHSWLGLGDDFDDKPEAGWILRHDQEGRGIAREAMDAVLAWFEAEHGPQAIVCLIELGHARSIRLAGRLGFAPLRDAVLLDGAAVELFARPPGNKT